MGRTCTYPTLAASNSRPRCATDITGFLQVLSPLGMQNELGGVKTNSGGVLKLDFSGRTITTIRMYWIASSRTDPRCLFSGLPVYLGPWLDGAISLCAMIDGRTVTRH